MQQWRKAAAGGETTLSGTDDFSTSLAYTAGAEMVYINGVLLERGVDYTASNGTTVTGLTALVAGDVATVASPSSFSVANAIPLSTVTAKGDLIAASSSGTVTNLAVGADGTTLVANSSAATGMSWAGPSVAAGKNAIINGGFDIWQRGTSVSLASGTGYTACFYADRFQLGGIGANEAATISRQVTNDTANLPNIQYCSRIQRNSGQTGTSAYYGGQTIETANAIPLAGKTVTYSFYARAGANYSATSNALGVLLESGTGIDQNINGTWTNYTAVISSTATLTTTWQRFTFTGTIAATATELSARLIFTPTGTAGVNDYYEVTGVQLEVGAVATPFSRAGGTIQGELAACQRYYQSLNGSWSSYGAAGSIVANYYRHQTQMRVTPTITVTTAPSYTNSSGLTNDENSVTGSRFYASVTSTGAGFATNFIYSASAEL